jgi:hypothetical protein
MASFPEREQWSVITSPKLGVYILYICVDHVGLTEATVEESGDLIGKRRRLVMGMWNEAG